MVPFEEFGKSVFKDVSALDFDYVPNSLVHRDKQMKRLFLMFRPTVETNVSQTAFLTGSVGTGKTALSKRFCLDFQEWGQKKGRNVEFVSVNCRQRNTESSVLLKVINHFDRNFPDRGFSVPEMLEVLRKFLDKRRSQLIVVLDEADVLIKKRGSDLIYHFSRFDEEKMGGRNTLSLILISQRYVLDMLDSASLSTFKRTNVVEFGKYNYEELKDIVAQRVELAFHPNIAEENAAELVADLASKSGDARHAIELLWKAGMLADEEASEVIKAEHVRWAKAEIFSFVTESKLKELDKSRKLVLLAVARTMKDNAYVTTGEVEKNYAVVCEEYEEEPRGHTQFWSYLKDLDARGLIEAKKSGRGISGKTTLISLPDIPAKVLKEKLTELLE